MHEVIRNFEKGFIAKKTKYPKFKSGDTIEVICEYSDGNKNTLQTFKGIVIQRRHPNTNGETFTVRKVVDGIAVEKIFPILSPTIKNIKIVSLGIVRKARLFYIRDKKGKDSKIKTKFVKKANAKNEKSVEKTDISEKTTDNNETKN